jgi:hypothetical protein
MVGGRADKNSTTNCWTRLATTLRTPYFRNSFRC